MPRLFPLFRPDPSLYPRSSSRPEGVTVRWLGTAGHVVSGAGTTLLIDPFLTRTSLLTTAFSPLRPTPERWWHHLPQSVDAVLLGHSHYDHLLDAPTIARDKRALIAGSRSTARFALQERVPEASVITVPPEGKTFTVGAATVRFVPSLHGRLVAGRVPFEGEADERPRLPARLYDYKMGGAFGILIELCGLRIYHNGSANLIDAELEGLSADVVLLGLAGRYGTPGYVRRVVSTLSPGLVVPTHHDAFFAPLEQGVHLLPGIDLQGFRADLAALAATPRLITPTYDDVIVVPTNAPSRDAVVVPL